MSDLASKRQYVVLVHAQLGEVIASNDPNMQKTIAEKLESRHADGAGIWLRDDDGNGIYLPSWTLQHIAMVAVGAPKAPPNEQIVTAPAGTFEG